jgi:hypothetical protein
VRQCIRIEAERLREWYPSLRAEIDFLESTWLIDLLRCSWYKTQDDFHLQDELEQKHRRLVGSLDDYRWGNESKEREDLRSTITTCAGFLVALFAVIAMRYYGEFYYADNGDVFDAGDVFTTGTHAGAGGTIEVLFGFLIIAAMCVVIFTLFATPIMVWKRWSR